MASGLLSLKWNNHRSTFFHVLSTIRSKESYCDVTLACDGRFYSLHKFVLSTCSEYFEEMFERTQCKHPVIVLKDIKHDDLEALLNYMYVGEVNVVQEKLAGLIKAAECLKIKGLAVPDEDPMESKESLGREQQQHKRSQRTEDSPRAKRRRRENSSDVSESLNPARSRHAGRSRDHNNVASKTNIAPSEENQLLDSREDEDSEARVEETSYNKESRQTNASNRSNRSPSSQKNKSEPEEVTLDDDEVKPEPIDPPPDEEDTENHEGDHDNKDALHHELGFDSEGMGGDNNYDDMGDQLQNMEDVVADAIPGSSGYQENSFPMWEGEGSLSNFPVEGFSGDNSQARQMAAAPGGGRLQLASSLWSSAAAAAAALSPSLYAATLRADLGGTASSATTGDGSTNMDGHSAAAPGDATSLNWNKKSYDCSFCQKVFYSSFELKRHHRTHTGERPYGCPYCPHRCKQKCHLKTHLQACKAAPADALLNFE